MWTYSSYIELIKEGMDCDTTFFLRHDVDLSLKKAVELAEIESEAGIHSTYYILLTSQFYNALSPDNIQRIKTIRELGMGIGLHYDPSVLNLDNHDMVKSIVQQGRVLEDYIGDLNGTSVTFHKPVMGKQVDVELLDLLDTVEIYCPTYDIRFKYISDSGHNWRENPYDTVLNFDMVHLNTHPVWYSHMEYDMEEALYELEMDKEGDKLIQKEINSIKQYREIIDGPQV